MYSGGIFELGRKQCFHSVVRRAAAEAGSRHDFLYDAARAIKLREPLLQALKVVSQLVVLQAQQVQNRGVQVPHLDGVFDGLKSEVVGRSGCRCAWNLSDSRL